MNRFLFVCFGICLASAVGCNDDLCGNQVLQELTSPGVPTTLWSSKETAVPRQGLARRFRYYLPTRDSRTRLETFSQAGGDRKGIPLDSHGAMHPTAAQVFQKVSDYQGLHVTYVAD
jgi:hypothetical protein